MKKNENRKNDKRLPTLNKMNKGNMFHNKIIL